MYQLSTMLGHMRKAISPMVATVLLVAFTIGVGALISIFATGLTTTSTGITSNQSESLSRCAGAWINVYKVTNTTIFYSNPNSQTITSLVAFFSDGKQSASAIDQSLAIGESNYTEITNSTGASGGVGVSSGILTGIRPGGTTGNTSVILRGLCLSTVTVQGKCSQGDGCWEA